MSRVWVSPTLRDEVVATIREYQARTGYRVRHLLGLAAIPSGKFYDWCRRVSRPNRHNGRVVKGHWLLDWERAAIIDYAHRHDTDGYRRLSYQMIDEDVAYASPSSVYRVLQAAGLLQAAPVSDRSLRGCGYEQPTGAHQEWHTDITCVNVLGTYLLLIAILDGYSRYVVHHDLRAHIDHADVMLVIEQARDKYPEARPRIISDRGGPFIAKEFKEYLRLAGLKQTLISAGYPQSNGKIERFYRTVKSECVRRSSFLSLADARQIIAGFIETYNNRRLHSALDYIAPMDILRGRRAEIIKTREVKLAQARVLRQEHNNQIPTLNQTPVLSGFH